MRRSKSLFLITILAATGCAPDRKPVPALSERAGAGGLPPDWSPPLNQDLHCRHSDPVLAWNFVMLSLNAADHRLSSPDQNGPVRTSRAFAITQIAVADAVQTLAGAFAPRALGASVPAAVGAAAFTALSALYPQQSETLARIYRSCLAEIADGPARVSGLAAGERAAHRILALRRDDGSNLRAVYVAQPLPGRHVADPTNPDQGFLDPHWGRVIPFAIPSAAEFRSPPPPPLGSGHYAQAFHEVANLGGDARSTPTQRSVEQTLIGIYWSYDGTPGLGTPPRLYNQIAQVIARQAGNNVLDNARLFMLLNVAMADAGIQTWDSKYHYAYWRPIVALRASGLNHWTPLGAPLSNRTGINFTPNFPAYPSGHASFGAAAFKTLELFFGTDAIAFSFVSDELNGTTRGSRGEIRPRVERHFRSLRQAAEENAQSRIYLGIHWEFDKTEGIRAGNQVAEYVFRHFRQPPRVSSLQR